MASSKHGRLFSEKDVRGLIVLALTHPAIGNPYRIADAVLSGEFGTYEMTFPADEPLFLLRGQDEAAPAAIGLAEMDYASAAKLAGASDEHVAAAVRTATLMASWQYLHPDRVKVPD